MMALRSRDFPPTHFIGLFSILLFEPICSVNVIASLDDNCLC